MLRTDASTATQPIQTEKWLFRHLCLAFVPFTIFHRQTLAKENRNSATTQLKKVHLYAMSDTSHTPNVIYIQHSEPRHIRELQNLIMGARLYFHVLVSDRGLLEQNAWINQTKRGQLNTQQMQRANKSNCILAADCRAHLRFSAGFHGHEREFPLQLCGSGIKMQSRELIIHRPQVRC